MMKKSLLAQLKNYWLRLGRVGARISNFAGCLCLCFVLLNLTMPTQAAQAGNSRLEEQVLQIIREHPEAIVESIQAYQQRQQQQLQQAQQSFLDGLRTNPRSIIGSSPYQGSEAFNIVLVEFSDFQCPYCADASQTLKQFMAKHKNQVTLVYKHFPITPAHPEAMAAAQAAWAAGQQGKFWEYHDALFSQQGELGEDFYQALAGKLNLNLEQFERDRTLANSAITQDMQLAANLGISGTPFFVMNDEVFTGAIQLDELEQILARVTARQEESAQL